MLWAVCKVFRGLFAIERVLGLSTVPLHDAFLKLTALTLKRDGERFPIVVGSPKTSSILFEQFGVFAHQVRINRVIRYVTEQNLALSTSESFGGWSSQSLTSPMSHEAEK